MSWNKNKACFVANVRKPNDSGWLKKWLPKGMFSEGESLLAESWLISWLADSSRSNPQVVNKKTLAVFLPRWLDLRRKDLGTGYKTLLTYQRSAQWILDNPKFPHFSIQDLDMTSELCQVNILRSWIQSLPGAMASRIQTIAALSVFFNDAVAEGWLDEDFVNPMKKRAVISMVKELKEMRRKTAEVKTLPWNQMIALTNKELFEGTKRPSGLPRKRPWLIQLQLVRRTRYLLAVTSGLRDSELQGLVWSDLHLDAPIPFVQVSRQLVHHGKKPWKVYERELAKGVDKLSILTGEFAVVATLKTASSAAKVPLHPVTVSALKALHNSTSCHESDDPVFSYEGRFYQTRAEVLRDDMRRLGFETSGITFHAIRRTFASKLAQLGVDDGKIERLLRHSKQTVARVHYIQDELEPLYQAVCLLPLSTH